MFDFPNSPSLNQQYSVGSKSWKWNGTAWELISISDAQVNAAAASAASAAASYDSFDDRYLGAKTSAPTLDNDGNALLVGALYWNSTANTLYFWAGSIWSAVSTSTTIETLTNKTIALGSNTVSGTTAQFNTALTDNDFATLTGSETLTSKTINLTSNTLVATSAQLAAALTDETGTGSAVFATSPALAGVPLTTTAVVDTNTTQIASTAYVVGQAASVAPLMDSVAAVGTSLKYARQDHVHPSDIGTSGTWAPTLTTSSPGDLSVVYSTQVGSYTKTGSIVIVTFNIITSSFTWTTTSSNWVISGLPFISKNVANAVFYDSLGFQGITKASYTNFSSRILPNTQQIELVAGGSGQVLSFVNAADMPSGGSLILQGSISYLV